jgi:sialate O-acetylesterase
MKPGGPYVMKVTDGVESVILKNVLIGEVWIASGQSNMEFTLSRAANASAEIKMANYPGIRFFTVQRATALTPQDEVKGTWDECNSKNAPDFSAVAYFFARHLTQTMGVNVGVIHTSWGGTPAESWTDEATLKSNLELAPLLTSLNKMRHGDNEITQQKKRMTEWEDWWEDIYEDVQKFSWAAPDADLSAWQPADVPQGNGATVLGSIDGVVWYRREVVIPDSWAGKTLVLKLAAIDDFDDTFLNGIEVGKTGRETPNWYMAQREYKIPANLFHPGVNTLAVRITDIWLGGGFTGDADQMSLGLADGSHPAIPLAGESWKTRTEFTFDPKHDPARPTVTDESGIATVLYNGMIAPLVPYGIRGAIWYQGEANADRAAQYRTLFPAMIDCWRNAWDDAFPFYYVQLANFMGRKDIPSESQWAELREAQLMTLDVKRTGMAVIIDIGDANDIHPRDKQDVGKRLALWAEAKTYDVDAPYSGPLFESMKIKNGKAILKFDHVDSGLAVHGDKLKGFSIAGPDGRFVWAEAEIKDDRIVVWSPAVAEPKAVRYAWADNPEANLYNGAGLPASPFRTDAPR